MKISYIDKLAFIDIKNRKVLTTISKEKDTWYIPGGKRKRGESDKKALIREVKEELTIDLIPSSLTYYATFRAQAHGKPKGTIVRMTCYTGEYIGQLKPSSEIRELRYVNYSWKDKSSPVDKIIFDDLKKNNLID
jgi:8-oxo-dGTP pyrophosphatase MutT (NUDIX family)